MSKRDFGKWLYDKLPHVYKDKDKENSYTLERFLEVLGTEGYNYLLNEMEELEKLSDLYSCPDKYLPYLSESLGVEYFHFLPPEFNRRLLINIQELLDRKGTRSAIKFIARELTGFEAEIIELQQRQIRTWSNNPHIEYDMWEVSKTFNQQDTDLHHLLGDKYTHRNFIVRLVAPYEQGTTEMKENAFREVVNSFLANHSKIFIVTIYFFDDEKRITRDVVESMLRSTISDYNEEISVVCSQSYTNYDILTLGREYDTNTFNNTSGRTKCVLNRHKLGSEMYLNIYSPEKIKFRREEETHSSTHSLSRDKYKLKTPYEVSGLRLVTGKLLQDKTAIDGENYTTKMSEEDRPVRLRVSRYTESKKVVCNLPDESYIFRNRLSSNMILTRKVSKDIIRVKGEVVSII